MENEKNQASLDPDTWTHVLTLTLSVDDVPEDEGGAEPFTRALDADSHEAVGVVGGVRVRHGDGQNASWRQRGYDHKLSTNHTGRQFRRRNAFLPT